MTEAVVTIIDSNTVPRSKSEHRISVGSEPLVFEGLGVTIRHLNMEGSKVEFWQMNADGVSGRQQLVPEGETRAYQVKEAHGFVVKIEHKKV
jgi:hypothetical protein